jgi:hypothetical protein
MAILRVFMCSCLGMPSAIRRAECAGFSGSLSTDIVLWRCKASAISLAAWPFENDCRGAVVQVLVGLLVTPKCISIARTTPSGVCQAAGCV